MNNNFQELDDRQENKAEDSSSWQHVYRCADKSSWYDSVAAAYDRTRPRYPRQILSKMQEVAKLQPGKSALEIGAGVGIATVELAKLGARIVCLEPSKSAGAIARQKCAASGNVEVINSTFEEWKLEAEKFEVVVAATFFHWVTPDVRYVKTAAALKDNGLLILLWNTPPQPSYELYQSCQDIYQTYAPELSKYESHQEYLQQLNKIAQTAIASGYFQDLTTESVIVPISYTVDDYLTLLSTLSPYIKLKLTQREKLFAALKTELGRSLKEKEQLQLSYLSLLHIAHKR